MGRQLNLLLWTSLTGEQYFALSKGFWFWQQLPLCIGCEPGMSLCMNIGRVQGYACKHINAVRHKAASWLKYSETILFVTWGVEVILCLAKITKDRHGAQNHLSRLAELQSHFLSSRTCSPTAHVCTAWSNVWQLHSTFWVQCSSWQQSVNTYKHVLSAALNHVLIKMRQTIRANAKCWQHRCSSWVGVTLSFMFCSDTHVVMPIFLIMQWYSCISSHVACHAHRLPHQQTQRCSSSRQITYTSQQSSWAESGWLAA